MINRIMNRPTAICLETLSTPAPAPLPENYFATVPMQAARPSYTRQRELEEQYFATVPMLAISPARLRQRELEEELHTSFEEAISERAARVSARLRRLSTTTALTRAEPETDALPATRRFSVTPLLRFWREHRDAIRRFCLGLGLFLIGFDLMGLLVMLAR